MRQHSPLTVTAMPARDARGRGPIAAISSCTTGRSGLQQRAAPPASEKAPQAGLSMPMRGKWATLLAMRRFCSWTRLPPISTRDVARLGSTSGTGLACLRAFSDRNGPSEGSEEPGERASSFSSGCRLRGGSRTSEGAFSLPRWRRESKRPDASPAPGHREETARYHRHILHAGNRPRGTAEAEGRPRACHQRRCGPGRRILQYLAALGVGALGIADDDHVLPSEPAAAGESTIPGTIGEMKTESARHGDRPAEPAYQGHPFH